MMPSFRTVLAVSVAALAGAAIGTMLALFATLVT